MKKIRMGRTFFNCADGFVVKGYSGTSEQHYAQNEGYAFVVHELDDTGAGTSYLRPGTETGVTGTQPTVQQSIVTETTPAPKPGAKNKDFYMKTPQIFLIVSVRAWGIVLPGKDFGLWFLAFSHILYF